MEIFDVIDKDGNPTGETVTREQAHTEGIPHRTAHIWILRKKEGRIQVLLQKRSKNKDSFPGMFDTSSAGHIQQVMNRSNLHSANSKKNSGFMQHRNSSTLLEPSRSPSRKNSTEKCSEMKNSHLCIFMISQWISRS